jgi:hypothetical protein
MKATELRIGNFVDCNGIVSEIVEIRTNYVKLKYFREDVKKEHTSLVDLDDMVKKIPLTEEWLLKFGYYDENSPNHFTKNEYTIDAHTFWKCNEMFIEDKNGVYVKYVHQLQNLYFALKQRELTIKKQE